VRAHALGSGPGRNVKVCAERLAKLDQWLVDQVGQPIPRWFRNVALALKVVLMNLLTTAASVGSTVAIFQGGWLASVLEFASVGFATGLHAGYHLRGHIRPLDGLPGVPGAPDPRGVARDWTNEFPRSPPTCLPA
jgi:hypothetical protein